jgi:hypothetical protein
VTRHHYQSGDRYMGGVELGNGVKCRVWMRDPETRYGLVQLHIPIDLLPKAIWEDPIEYTKQRAVAGEKVLQLRGLFFKEQVVRIAVGKDLDGHNYVFTYYGNLREDLPALKLLEDPHERTDD